MLVKLIIIWQSAVTDRESRKKGCVLNEKSKNGKGEKSKLTLKVMLSKHLILKQKHLQMVVKASHKIQIAILERWPRKVLRLNHLHKHR